MADATGVGPAELEMTGMGGSMGGPMPSGMPSDGTDRRMTGGTGAINGTVNFAKLTLAAGYVVMEPGTRGRSLTDSSGPYVDTAPAVTVDLRAAVRHIRATKDRIPGDVERMVSTGAGAGGASSALLGASGDSKLYEPHLGDRPIPHVPQPQRAGATPTTAASPHHRRPCPRKGQPRGLAPSA
ncbi:hypothetical protein ACFQ9U_02445 [Streptomyces sp. NPDC056568]|uniref:hypothetical protein n=1 Tax=Streptomyces sp. NPDC056568 TaxID=3345866 RepID=UPI0036B0099E